MAAPKVTDEDLLEKISQVFRLYGYEGASIRLLSEATGLERASLYHRYPGGKEDMASAVITAAAQWLTTHVFDVLRGAGEPAEKVRRAAAGLAKFYGKGTLWCVMDSMTLGTATPKLREQVRGAYEAWLAAFTGVGRESGLPPAKARQRAQQALVGIEGSLVISRVTGDTKPFTQALDDLPALLSAN